MKEYGIMTDIDKCVGCHACEVACKQENSLDVGVFRIKVEQIGPSEENGKLVMTFVPIRCRHCTRPACVEACPSGALEKRENGLVLVDSDECIGCLQCIEACPFGAISFDDKKGVIEKCTLCAHRIEEGLLPACVHHCMSGALQFGKIDELVSNARRKAALRVSSAFAAATSEDQ